MFRPATFLVLKIAITQQKQPGRKSEVRAGVPVVTVAARPDSAVGAAREVVEADQAWEVPAALAGVSKANLESLARLRQSV
jgi:hypothetical protein